MLMSGQAIRMKTKHNTYDANDARTVHGFPVKELRLELMLMMMMMGSRLRGVLLERVVAYDPACSCQRSTLRQGTRITCNMQLDGLGKGKLATAFAPPDDASDDDDDDDGDSHSMPVLLVKGPRKGQHSLWPR